MPGKNPSSSTELETTPETTSHTPTAGRTTSPSRDHLGNDNQETTLPERNTPVLSHTPEHQSDTTNTPAGRFTSSNEEHLDTESQVSRHPKDTASFPESREPHAVESVVRNNQRTETPPATDLETTPQRSPVFFGTPGIQRTERASAFWANLERTPSLPQASRTTYQPAADGRSPSPDQDQLNARQRTSSTSCTPPVTAPSPEVHREHPLAMTSPQSNPNKTRHPNPEFIEQCEKKQRKNPQATSNLSPRPPKRKKTLWPDLALSACVGALGAGAAVAVLMLCFNLTALLPMVLIPIAAFAVLGALTFGVIKGVEHFRGGDAPGDGGGAGCDAEPCVKSDKQFLRQGARPGNMWRNVPPPQGTPYVTATQGQNY